MNVQVKLIQDKNYINNNKNSNTNNNINKNIKHNVGTQIAEKTVKSPTRQTPSHVYKTPNALKKKVVIKSVSTIPAEQEYSKDLEELKSLISKVNLTVQEDSTSK